MFEITVIAAFNWFITLPLWQAILLVLGFNAATGALLGMTIAIASFVWELMFDR